MKYIKKSTSNAMATSTQVSNPVFTELDSGVGDAPLHVTTNENIRLKLTASGTYVRKNESTGMYITTDKGILPAFDDKDVDIGEPYVAIGDEEDIAPRLPGAVRPTYTLPIGVAWNNGEMTALFCFDDTIVEYRKNIGRPSGKINRATGTQPNYMITYASVGIPKARYQWLIEYAEVGGVKIVNNERDQENNGYMWINANITREYHPGAIIITENDTVKIFNDSNQNLKSVLTTTQRNVIGVVGLEINLKRAASFSRLERNYVLSLSLKMMQVINITDISSPPLNKTVEFLPKKVKTAKNLLDMLRAGGPQNMSPSFIGSSAGVLPGQQSSVPSVQSNTSFKQ